MTNENQIVMKNFNAIKRLLKEQNIEVNSVGELKIICTNIWYHICTKIQLEKYAKDFEEIGVYYNKSANGLIYCDRGSIVAGGQSKVYAINCNVELRQLSVAMVNNCIVIAKNNSNIVASKSKVLHLDNSKSSLTESFAILKDNSFTNATNSTVLDKSNGLSTYIDSYVKVRGNNSNFYDCTIESYKSDFSAVKSKIKCENSFIKAEQCDIEMKNCTLSLQKNNKVKATGGTIYDYSKNGTNEIEGDANIIRMQ